METLTDHRKIKASILKAMDEMQVQKNERIIERIANLPSLSDLPEIQALKKKQELKANGVLKDQTKKPAPIRYDHCFSAPYMPDFESSSSNAQTRGGALIPDIFASYSVIKHDTGEISLAAVSGIHNDDIYCGEKLVVTDAWSFNVNKACATVSQLVEIDPKPYKRLVTIDVNAMLPEHYEKVVRLIPGPSSGYLRGLVGSEGYLDVYTGTSVPDVEHITNGTITGFLHSWRDWQSGDQHSYINNPSCRHQVILPENATMFWINVIVQINAYSPYFDCSSELNIPHAQQIALIDLRLNRTHHIWREEFDGGGIFPDHLNPGPIKITKFCYRIEPLNQHDEPNN